VSLTYFVLCVGSAGGNRRSAETYQGAGSSEPRTGLSAGAATASGLRLGARRDGRQGVGCGRRGRVAVWAQSYHGKFLQLSHTRDGSFMNESFTVSD
jgi:hypothetical protein